MGHPQYLVCHCRANFRSGKLPAGMVGPWVDDAPRERVAIWGSEPDNADVWGGSVQCLHGGSAKVIHD